MGPPLLFLAGAFLLAGAMWAQRTATLKGRVLDPNGGAVSSASDI